MAKTLRVCLAALKQRPSVPEGVERLIAVLRECQKQEVDIVCTPEAYLPGLRGRFFRSAPPGPTHHGAGPAGPSSGLPHNGRGHHRRNGWQSELGLENRAFVISPPGRVLGYQTKNQITPGGESENYVPDGQRRVFTVKGVRFGITICHEGWRYPETVRWPAVRGARIVFQPQVTGSDEGGQKRREWGESFYEKAMQCRAGENNIYFASVNQAMRGQNSATSLIDPQGNLISFVPYGKEDLLIADLDIEKATRFYTKRYRSELYPA